MHHQEFEPPGILRDSIKCFWYNRKDAEADGAAFEVVPDGYTEIIFYFGDLWNTAADGTLQPLPSPFMMGLLDQPVHFYTKGRLEIIGVRCFPWTVFDLLGLPSGKKNIHLFEHAIAGLQPGLARHMQAGKVVEALASATQYFSQIRSQVAIDSMLFKAGEAMREANGTMPVNRVAAAAHATVRTLERRFKQSSGHSVKDVSGLIRFEQVRNHLWHHPDANIAALAAELGYTDQSHLSREFKRYTGTTPAAFARKARNGKRALSTDFVAFVQA